MPVPTRKVNTNNGVTIKLDKLHSKQTPINKQDSNFIKKLAKSYVTRKQK